jgi:hypothetical protein
MSAFIVSKETINCVASAWYQENRPCEQLDQIGQRLWKLNERAVNIRYPAGAHEESALPEFRYRPKNYKLVQQFKSVQCLRYQCAEGDIPDTSPLFGEMTDLMNTLARKIVDGLPEYDSAAWDLR